MEEHGSDLLTMLGQLNDATWSQVLLPLLRRTKSAASFALACRQLQQLCHGHQRRLGLTLDNTSHLDSPLDLDTFSRHFPAGDDIRWCSGWRSACNATSEMQGLSRLLPALARLPSLSSLELDLVGLGKRGVAAASVVPVLRQLQLQLPQLRSLVLLLPNYWSGDDRRAWAALGAATQLTKLTMDFAARFSDNDDSSDEDDFSELNLRHLSALQPLSSLQHLTLECTSTNEDQRQDCSFLSSFSALTSLQMPLISKRSGLAAISSCTALQDLQLINLQLQGPRWPQNGLAAAECAAIAQLTLLRQLHVWSVADTAAILAALPLLRALRTLRLPQMTNAHLSVLATLTSLTNLQGRWAQGAEAGAPPVCASVTSVCISGPWPLAAFPAAKAITLHDSWQPTRLAGLGQHMKALERVQVLGAKVPDMHPTLDASASRSERVAAVRSLALLPHLAHLEFALNDDAEAAALATFCTQLKQLALHEARGSRVTAVGLATVLNKLGRRHSVHLHNLQLHEDDALLLLSGLSSVQRLEVHWDDVDDVEAWEAAAEAAVEAGLPLPADYHC